MLLVYDLLDEIMTRHILAVNEFLDQLVLGKQFLHIGQVIQDALVFTHRAGLPLYCNASTRREF